MVSLPELPLCRVCLSCLAMANSSDTPFFDLSLAGDVSGWIGKQKIFTKVPQFVVNEVSCRVDASPADLARLPSNGLPVAQLLEANLPSRSSTAIFY